jgi:limonene-1,2-epoxide hydrolase
MTQPVRRGRWRLAVLAIVGVIVLGTMLASCRSTGPHDFVGAGKAALERTDGLVAEGARLSIEDTEAGIDRFLALFSDFSRDAVEAASIAAYAENAYFNDGFAEIEGNEAIAAYFARTADSTAEIEVEIEDRVVAEGEIYLRWIMSFTTAGARGRTIVAPGVTHLRFDSEGRIAYHRDYWDASGALAEFVPLVGSVLRSVRARLESE